MNLIKNQDITSILLPPHKYPAIYLKEDRGLLLTNIHANSGYISDLIYLILS